MGHKRSVNQSQAVIPQDWHESTGGWAKVSFFIPDSLMWRVTVLSLIDLLGHGRFWRSDGPRKATNPQAVEIIDVIKIGRFLRNFVMIKPEEYLLSELKTRQEIEFTLKHLLTIFSSNKSIYWLIDKPPAPTPTNGNPGLSHGIYKSNLEYNIIKDAGNPDNPGSNQLWGLGELLAKAFLDYADENDQPLKPPSIVVESLLKISNGKSLEEIEYTLKTLLTMLGKDKDIKIYIDKPVAATAGANATLEVNRESAFETDSLLETNSITDVLKVALLNDGTIQLPDVNPFNLESKVDTLNYLLQAEFDEIDEKLDAHNQSLTYIWKTFYAGLDINPFLDESFFSLIRRSLHNTGFGSDEPYLQKLNTLYEMANFQGVAAFANSYRYSFYTWINGTFTPLFTAMKECICAIPGAVKGLSLSPTINVAPANPVISVHGEAITNNITVEPTPITNTVNVSPTPITNTVNVSPTPVTNTVNVDACCDDGTQPPVVTPPQTTYPPIDPTQPVGPNNPTTQPYDPTLPKPLVPTIIDMQNDVSVRTAFCGYNYFIVGKYIEWIDWLFDYINYYQEIITTLGPSILINDSIAKYGKTLVGGGVSLSKTPQNVLKISFSQMLVVVQILDTFEVLQEALEIWRHEFSCNLTGHDTYDGVLDNLDGKYYRNSLTNALLTSTTFDPVVMDALALLMSTFIDYGMYSVDVTNGKTIFDYAQYCPCPEDVPTGCNTQALLPLPLIAPYNGYAYVSSPFCTNETDNEVLPLVWSPIYQITDSAYHTVVFEFDTLYSYGVPALPSDVIGVFDVYLRVEYSFDGTNWTWWNMTAKPFDFTYGGINLPLAYQNMNPYPYSDRFGNITWEVANGKLKVCVTVRGYATLPGSLASMSTSLVRFAAQPRIYIHPPSTPVNPLSLNNNGNNTATVNYNNIVFPPGSTTTLTINGQNVTLPSGTQYITPTIGGEVIAKVTVETVNANGSVTTTVYTNTITLPCASPIINSFSYVMQPDGVTARVTWGVSDASSVRILLEDQNAPKHLLHEFTELSNTIDVVLPENATSEIFIEAVALLNNCPLLGQSLVITTGAKVLLPTVDTMSFSYGSETGSNRPVIVSFTISNWLDVTLYKDNIAVTATFQSYEYDGVVYEWWTGMAECEFGSTSHWKVVVGGVNSSQAIREESYYLDPCMGQGQPNLQSFFVSQTAINGGVIFAFTTSDAQDIDILNNGVVVAHSDNIQSQQTLSIPQPAILGTQTYTIRVKFNAFCFTEMSRQIDLIDYTIPLVFSDITENLGGAGNYRLPMGSRTLLHESWVKGMSINWPSNITVIPADNGVGNEEGDYPLMSVPNPRIVELNVSGNAFFVDGISQYGDVYQIFRLDTVIIPNISNLNNGTTPAYIFMIGKYGRNFAIKFSYLYPTPVITGSGTFPIIGNAGTTGDLWLVLVPEYGLQLQATPTVTRADNLGLYRYGELPQITTHIAGYRRMPNLVLSANGYYMSFQVRCPRNAANTAWLRPCSAKIAAIRVDVIDGENTNVGIYSLTGNRYIGLSNEMAEVGNAEISVISGYLSVADYNAINALAQVNFITLCEVGFCE